MKYRMACRPTAPAAQSIVNKLTGSILLLGCSISLLAQSPSEARNTPSVIRGTHIMGFVGAAKNASGTLSVEGDALKFHKTGAAAAKVSLTSIQSVLLGVQDKQVGGATLAVGRAAVPFGGGRAVALFSHKQYDTLTLEYLDADGGYHGAIFQLNKGQGEVLKDRLVAGGVHVVAIENQSPQPSASEAKNEKK